MQAFIFICFFFFFNQKNQKGFFKIFLEETRRNSTNSKRVITIWKGKLSRTRWFYYFRDIPRKGIFFSPSPYAKYKKREGEKMEEQESHR